MLGGNSYGWQEQPQLLSSVYPPNPITNGSPSSTAAAQSNRSSTLPSQPAATTEKASIWSSIGQYHQYLLDRSTPHTLARWFTFFLLLFCYVLRIYFIQSHHIITYAYAIYLLSLLIGFLTPKIDPDWMTGTDDGDDAAAGDLLPRKAQDEFRPFMRRLPEFRCWLSAIRATLIALMCTLTRVFDVPVFWPILVIYFVMLFILTMKRQIAHMLRHRYIPFSIGKRRYFEKPRNADASNGRVIQS